MTDKTNCPVCGEELNTQGIIKCPKCGYGPMLKIPASASPFFFPFQKAVLDAVDTIMDDRDPVDMNTLLLLRLEKNLRKVLLELGLEWVD